MKYTVAWEATPNPQSLKFLVNRLHASAKDASAADASAVDANAADANAADSRAVDSRAADAGAADASSKETSAGASAPTDSPQTQDNLSPLSGSPQTQDGSSGGPEGSPQPQDGAAPTDSPQMQNRPPSKPPSATAEAEKAVSPSLVAEAEPRPPDSSDAPFLCDEIFEADSPQKAARSPLAAKILGFPWAKSVFMAENFVTVTKEDWVEWELAAEPLADLIKDHFNQGGKALLPQTSSSADSPKSEGATASAATGGGNREERLIRDIIEKEIQPAVAMDGGYIDFVSYENKTVYLNLQGACSGCPSSSYTLKEGIETRLKQSLPEIEEVIAV